MKCWTAAFHLQPCYRGKAWWFTGCIGGPPGSSSGVSQDAFAWPDSGDWHISFDRSVPCSYQWLSIFIITFPRYIMANPRGREWEGSSRWVSRSHLCSEFILFLYCVPHHISSAAQWWKMFWTSSMWVKSAVLIQKIRIEHLMRQVEILWGNCVPPETWFLDFKKRKRLD